MGTITETMVECVYQMARKVYAGEIGRTDARFAVHEQCGMDAGSAGDYISAFLYMMDGGKCYKRTINTFATEYYLEHIGIDYGRQAQITAAKIVKEHVKYYETKMGYQAQIDKIAEQYLQGVDTNDLKYQPASYNKTPVRGKVAKNKTDMTRELGQKLRTMYEMSGVNKVAMIQLFGILEADTIENNGVRVPDIVKEAGLSDSYKTEVSKGIKLAKYVQLKPEYKDMF